MNIFSYVLRHDYGLAPNPFGGHCTLAVCKPGIRKNKNLKLGDWIIGIAGQTLGKPNHLIYAMQVEEKIAFDDYWEDPRFSYKKPIENGSLVQMYGDNFYHIDKDTGEWIQENSAHSKSSSSPNMKHLNRDISGEYVLISQHFYYWGNKAPNIPPKFSEVVNEGRGFKYKKIPKDVKKLFIQWIQQNYESGIQGDPISWKIYLNK